MPNQMSPDLPHDVQMQFLRPSQLQAAGDAFPVVYVPFGLIEWHGKHLPLGNDALKAHAVCVKAAELAGGVVYPPVYFADCMGADILTPLLTKLFEQLRQTGFRVLIGISGHNVQGQIDMVDAALAPVVEDGLSRGYAGWEMSLSRSEESDSDHAAKWETSNMLHLYPDRVDMDELGDEEIILDMRPPWGLGGLDPRKHASAAVGARNIALCAESIAAKARELLESLPPEHRHFDQTILPGHWWLV